MSTHSISLQPHDSEPISHTYLVPTQPATAFAFAILITAIVSISPLFYGRIGKLFSTIVAKYRKSLRQYKSQEHTHLTQALRQFIHEDGGGQWPPKANHKDWPESLQPYQMIYFQLSLLLSTAHPSVDDSVNQLRRRNYQSEMRRLLAEHVSIEQVETYLRLAESGDWSKFSRDSYHGFYCCISMLRHAYRWGTNPVVTVAQMEKEISLPPELDVPWRYLQRHFGVTSDSGNLMSNFFYNVDEQEGLVYMINGWMPEVIKNSEQSFVRIFYNTEIKGFQIYSDLVDSIVAFDKGNKKGCLRHMMSVSSQLQSVIQNFFGSLKGEHVSISHWLSYIQGFHAWGAGRMLDGEFIEFDGLSGSHTLLFQVLDAFLGLKSFTSDKDNERSRLGNDMEDIQILEEVTKIVKLIRTFRAGHRSRAMTYLKEPAPERCPMTAGQSLLVADSSASGDALEPVEAHLRQRLKEVM